MPPYIGRAAADPSAGADDFASARSLTRPTFRRAARRNLPSDLLPGFEEKLGSPSAGVASGGKIPSFALQDGLAFVGFAAQAIAQDEFSKCFKQGPRRRFSPKTILLGPLYWLGWVIRYCILFPYRMALLLSATVFFFMALPVVLRLKNEEWQRWLFRFYCKAFLLSWGSRIRYHGRKPKVNQPHIFVSNHTSVIDYLVLSAHDFPHATVAQQHAGVIGYFEDKVLTLNGSLMFNRNEKNDRTVLSQKMKQHVENPKAVPLLIFPEGTCVNNEYTVLFHKGAFDLDCAVAPVAIRYNKRWADAYWHSKTQSFTKHLLYLMTRWALVADVWYLPPRSKKPDQTSVEFANEVKAEISAVAGLKNLSWDGYFKNFAPAKEKCVRLQEHPQTRYGQVLLNRMRNRPSGDRMGHLRRSASISYIPSASSSTGSPSAKVLGRDLFLQQQQQTPDYLRSREALTSAKNEILVAALEDRRSVEMIEEISHRKNDVVETWKRYTKMRSTDYSQRRIENGSWRLWFKQRIERQREEERRLMLEQAAEAEARARRERSGGNDDDDDDFDGEEDLTLSMLAAYNLMAALPSLFSPPIRTDDDEDNAGGGGSRRPRSRSMGNTPLAKFAFATPATTASASAGGEGSSPAAARPKMRRTDTAPGTWSGRSPRLVPAR
ncbi:hypothetical protein HDU87_005978 [Geranomyces variabilis]|uniref:Phospholipid/glycerol acyltransferase domain-containing protein n=1 Tax=Geranomyces variabilis TaxID=109894 RepID=A0AAD5XQ77_9FUNG|nr:hypothetical protein HDU87_005978 [Geranomyces variabilis]